MDVFENATWSAVCNLLTVKTKKKHLETSGSHCGRATATTTKHLPPLGFDKSKVYIRTELIKYLIFPLYVLIWLSFKLRVPL